MPVTRDLSERAGGCRPVRAHTASWSPPIAAERTNALIWGPVSGCSALRAHGDLMKSLLRLLVLPLAVLVAVVPAAAATPPRVVNVVAYEDGAQFSQGKGIVIRNLTAGTQVEVSGFDAQMPRAPAGRDDRAGFGY